MKGLSTLRIGSRQSPLAQTQAQWVLGRLQALGHSVEHVTFVTAGDRFLQGPLREIGGKGLFTKEIETALLDGQIDCAVHSYKDMATQAPDGLVIGAVLERGDVADVWIGRDAVFLSALPSGERVGTASLRRQAQIRHHFPHLICQDIRGNVGRRLEKLAQGEVDGLILAKVGLQRLGQLDLITEVLSLDVMWPAPAQGALVVQCRADDKDLLQILQSLDHAPTRFCTDVERGFLQALDGSCQTPIGAYAQIIQETLFFKGFIATPNLSWINTDASLTSLSHPHDFGFSQGLDLHSKICKS